jgi:hypothetical protein
MVGYVRPTAELVQREQLRQDETLLAILILVAWVYVYAWVA